MLRPNEGWASRARLIAMIVSWVAAVILLCPVGLLSAAQLSDIAPFFSDAAEQRSLFSTETPMPEGEQNKVNPRIAPRLQRAIARSAAAQAGALRVPQAIGPERIKVILQLAGGTTLDPQGITSRGGRILRQRADLVAAELPPGQIEDIIDAEPAIVFARPPYRFHPLAITSEGVSLTGATYFHTGGYRGAGVKVAVIDIGFKGLTQAKAADSLPQNVMTRDFSGRGLETQYKHGTACAEIVHAMAPDAELHLLKVADEDDFYAAFDYCREQQIKIISLSIGTFGSGPGDGTGPIDELCSEARANGILIVAAAGNGGNTTSGDGVPVGSHWEGAFTDANQDNVHEFAPGVQGNVLIALRDRDDDGNPELDEVTVVMRWNDWPHATTDYDLYLYTYDYGGRTRGELVASSVGIQNGTQPPVEGVAVDLSDALSYGFYELVVTRKPDSPAGKALEIYTGGSSYFIGATPYASPLAISEGSIMEPADAESVFAVGATSCKWWSGWPQESYSSQGPTNAWAGSVARIKPDISGPDEVSTYTYGASFPGTSAAAPHVAGAAALVWSLHPSMLPGDVQATLESWAQDTWNPLKNNLKGWGQLRLVTYPLWVRIFGEGTVSGSPGGIDCGLSCSAVYPPGVEITLMATANDGYTFTRWGIDSCSGTGPCTFTMDAAESAYVYFDQIRHLLSISMAGTGIGKVNITNQLNQYYGSCYLNSCSNSYYMGLPVTLTIEPIAGSTFAGWSGEGCSGRGTCTVSLETNKAVTATFVTSAPIAYIPNSATDSVSIVNTDRNVVMATVPVGHTPRSVAVNRAGTRVYIGNSLSNDVSVIDTFAKTVVATIPVGNAPYGVAVDSAGTRVYVANNGADSISVIDAANNAVVATIPVGSAPYGVAVDPSGSRVYVTNNGSNSVSVIDAASNAVVATVPVGNTPVGVKVDQDGARVYVPNQADNSVSVIDAVSNAVVATVPVGSAPFGVAVNPAGTRVYTANEQSNTVSVIDVASNAVVATVPVGNTPRGISIHPAGTKVYVTNYGAGYGYAGISVIDTATNEARFVNVVVSSPLAFGQFISAVALQGDLNDDGVVDIADAVLAMQVMSGMNPAAIRKDFATSAADLNGDRKISMEEAIYIMQVVALVR